MNDTERRMKIMDIANDIAINCNNAEYVRVRAENLVADVFCDCIGDGVMALFHITNGVPTYTINTEFGSYSVPAATINDKLSRMTTSPNRAITGSVREVSNEKEETKEEAKEEIKEPAYDNVKVEPQPAPESNVGKVYHEEKEETLEAPRETIYQENELNSQEVKENVTQNSFDESKEEDIAAAIDDVGLEEDVQNNFVDAKNHDESKEVHDSAENVRSEAFAEVREEPDLEGLEDEIASGLEEELDNIENHVANEKEPIRDISLDKPRAKILNISPEVNKQEAATNEPAASETYGNTEQHKEIAFGAFRKKPRNEETFEGNKSKFAALGEEKEALNTQPHVFNHPNDHGEVFKHTHEVTVTMKYNRDAVIGKYLIEFWPTWIQFGMTNQTFAECLVRVSNSAGEEEISIIDRNNKEFVYGFHNTDFKFKLVGVWNSGMLSTSVSIDNDSKYFMTDTLSREEPSKLDKTYLDQFQFISKGQPKYTILPLRSDNRGEEHIPIIGIAEENNTKTILRRTAGNTCQYTHNNRRRVITGHWENGKFNISVE